MHNKLLTWVQDKRAKLRSRGTKARQAHDGQKPFLSPWTSQRIALTPTPSRTDLSSSASVATADCAFFQRFPLEIRRKILIAAFGDRIMHMSLEFNHTRHLVPKDSLKAPYWVRYMPPTAKYPPHSLKPDTQTPKVWQWRGCPCWYRGNPRHVHTDDCLPGVARCWKHIKDVPDIYLIGSMGWLLTCRQAYVEGIEVLYSTNIFRLSNKNGVIIHHLRTLLSPHRLSMITSIELDLHLFDVMGSAETAIEDSRCQDPGRPGLLAILEAIPNAFPNLRTVCVDIWGALFWRLPLAERPPFYDQYLFEPVDNLVRRLGPQLQEFTLLVPYTISQKSIRRAVSEGWKFKQQDVGIHSIFWRPLSAPGINGQAEHQPEEVIIVEGSEAPGYWVTLGYFDDPYPPSGCFCTGSLDPELHNSINAELDSWTDKDKPQRREEAIPSQAQDNIL